MLIWFMYNDTIEKSEKVYTHIIRSQQLIDHDPLYIIYLFAFLD